MALRLTRHGGGAASATAPDAAYRAPTDAPANPSRRSNRAWIMLVLVLGAAAVAFLVMERSAGPTISPGPTPTLEGEPDIYMVSPVVSQYRADGRLEYRLAASDASHYQGDHLTLLSHPRLTLFRQQGAPWRISARKGTLHRPPGGADDETVALDQGVTLEQNRGDGEQIRLSTPSLRLYPQREYAETDRDVKIDSLFGQTTATGLRGDLQQGRLELRSANGNRVHTVLQPKQFK